MKIALRLRLMKDTKGQDLIEYALLAGFVAVALGAAMPNFITSVGLIYSRIEAALASSAGS